MADELRIGLKELLRKAQMEHDADFLKEGVRALSQAIMEMEVEEHIIAGVIDQYAADDADLTELSDRDQDFQKKCDARGVYREGLRREYLVW